MKRKTTDLEKRLINKGFRLDHKEYCGKHSEKTASYVYYGVVDTRIERVGVNVKLNAKRDTIVEWGINDFGKALPQTFTIHNLNEANLVMVDITNHLFPIRSGNIEDADKEVEILEEIENETK